MKEILQINLDDNNFYAALIKSKLSKRIYFTLTKNKDKAFIFNDSKKYITRYGEDFLEDLSEDLIRKLFLTEKERANVHSIKTFLVAI